MEEIKSIHLQGIGQFAKGGTVIVEVKPRGTRRNTRDERVRLYEWSHNVFLGQHGNPFGEVEAADINAAHDIVRGIVRNQLQRKHAYEEFYERA